MPRKNTRTAFDKSLEERTEEQLTESAKIFRDRFVMEYIKDFRGDLAVIRCGHPNPKSAKTRAYQLLREPYVARKLNDTVRTLRTEDVVQRQEVMARLWEESNNPSNLCGTRVAALAHVAKMLGMFLNKENDNHSAPMGVMFIPCTSPEDWASVAPTAQAVLKANAARHE